MTQTSKESLDIALAVGTLFVMFVLVCACLRFRQMYVQHNYRELERRAEQRYALAAAMTEIVEVQNSRR